MSDLEQRIKDAAEKSIINFILKDSWIAPDYANRFKVPKEFLADVWKLVDKDRLMAKLAERIESELADQIVSKMAAEISTDVKSILSDAKQRDQIRELAKKHIASLSGRDDPCAGGFAGFTV